MSARSKVEVYKCIPVEGVAEQVSDSIRGQLTRTLSCDSTVSYAVPDPDERLCIASGRRRQIVNHFRTRPVTPDSVHSVRFFDSKNPYPDFRIIPESRDPDRDNFKPKPQEPLATPKKIKD